MGQSEALYSILIRRMVFGGWTGTTYMGRRMLDTGVGFAWKIH